MLTCFVCHLTLLNFEQVQYWHSQSYLHLAITAVHQTVMVQCIWQYSLHYLFQPYVLDIHPVQMEATAHIQTLVRAKLDGVMPGVQQVLYTYLSYIHTN